MNGYGRWGYITLAIVAAGALQTVQGQESDQKGSEGRSGQRSSLLYGNPSATMAQMKQAFEIMKESNFDRMQLPMHLLQSPDHYLSESSINRDPKATTYAIPSDESHKEVAMYTGLYYRRNVSVYKHRSVYRPEGFFLVMFKTGQLVQVQGKDVRLIPAPEIDPTAHALCFPGMDSYQKSLPRLPEFQEPWYEGPPLD